MPTQQIDYTFIPGETVEQYNKRIDQARSQAGILTVEEANNFSKITSDDLSGNSFPKFQTSGNTPGAIPFFSTPAITPTPLEQKGQTLTDEIISLNEALIGESEFRTTKEGEFDIAGKTQTVNDLTNQLNVLKNESAAIPLALEKDAAGRGITTTILDRQVKDRLRDNAIASLSVSSLLEAANGNLATATSLVDRAVAAKFDPIREKIDISSKNLKLILESPQASIEDKNRAQAQLDAQNYQKDLIAKQEAEQTEVWNLAVKAANAGADATTLQKIQNAKTKEEALAIMQKAGLTGQTESSDIKSVQGGLYDVSSGKWIVEPSSGNEPLKATSFNIRAGIVGMTQSQVTDILQSTTPPKWFMDQVSETYQMSMTPEKYQELWNEYQAEQKRTIEGAASADGGDNPY